jgi:hypothetical protein
MGIWESSEIPESSKFDRKGQNTSHSCVLHIIGSYQSVDVENELALRKWTFASLVMAKRKVGNQIDNLTANH